MAEAPPGWVPQAPAGVPQPAGGGGSRGRAPGSSGDQSGYRTDRAGARRDTREGPAARVSLCVREGGLPWGATAHMAWYGDLEEKHRCKPAFHHSGFKAVVPSPSSSSLSACVMQ